METEIRFYYSIDCKENVINYLSKYTELNFLGRFYECTNVKELIHKEEEIELSIDSNEYNKLCLLLGNVLHLSIVESYERYRSIFCNDDIEIVVDEYPFGLCIELENKSKTKNPEEVIKEWLNKLNFNIKDAYRLSWDDKYAELCKEQNKEIEKIVRFNKNMPQIFNRFTLK